jgi:hypothetical protein
LWRLLAEETTKRVDGRISFKSTNLIVFVYIASIVYSRLASKWYFLSLEIPSISFDILDELSVDSSSRRSSRQRSSSRRTRPASSSPRIHRLTVAVCLVSNCIFYKVATVYHPDQTVFTNRLSTQVLILLKIVDSRVTTTTSPRSTSVNDPNSQHGIQRFRVHHEDNPWPER